MDFRLPSSVVHARSTLSGPSTEVDSSRTLPFLQRSWGPSLQESVPCVGGDRDDSAPDAELGDVSVLPVVSFVASPFSVLDVGRVSDFLKNPSFSFQRKSRSLALSEPTRPNMEINFFSGIKDIDKFLETENRTKSRSETNGSGRNRYGGNAAGGNEFSGYGRSDSGRGGSRNAGGHDFSSGGRGYGYRRGGGGGPGGGQYYRRGGSGGAGGSGGFQRGSGRGNFRGNQYNMRRGRGGRGGFVNRGGFANRGRGGFGQNLNNDRGSKKVSIEVRSDWNCLFERPFSYYSKLSVHSLPDTAEDLLMVGSASSYNKLFDTTSQTRRKRLESPDCVFPYLRTIDDPFMQEFISSAVADVYCTDDVLASLMVPIRSLNSWDVAVRCVDGAVILYARDPERFAQPFVNETGAEPPQDDDPIPFNTASSLSAEALAVQKAYSRSVIHNDVENMSELIQTSSKMGAFVDASLRSQNLSTDDVRKMCSKLFRYRVFVLASGLRILVRCEIDAKLDLSDRTEYCILASVLEYASNQGKNSWKASLENRAGAALTAAITDNSFSLAKYALRAYLGGCYSLKIGFVTRLSYDSNDSHLLLGTQTIKADALCQSLTLNLSNCWATAETLLDSITSFGDGKFLLCKEPAEHVLKLYSVPIESFASENEVEFVNLAASE